MKITAFFAVLALGVMPLHADNPAALKKARAKFEVADAELNTAYKALVAELDKGKAAELREKQRGWLQFRDQQAESFPHFNTGKDIDNPKLTVDYWGEMTDLTKARITFLHVYSGKNVTSGVTGEYCDAYNNVLEIEERKEGIYFYISAVSASAARNMGEIEGIAVKKGDKAFFKDVPEKGDDRLPCEITLTFIEGHIVKVEGKNTEYYHGNGAYFDGEYYKTGKFKKPESTK